MTERLYGTGALPWSRRLPLLRARPATQDGLEKMEGELKYDGQTPAQESLDARRGIVYNLGDPALLPTPPGDRVSGPHSTTCLGGDTRNRVPSDLDARGQSVAAVRRGLRSNAS